MQEYGYSDISEAKRRVQEMKNRAREKTAEDEKTDALSLILSLQSNREKALALALMYVINSENVSNELLLFIFYLIKYGN
ncbi:MAG: hypothetical protein IKS12_05565 [Eubacterium sp.]|nr:hypothetical protein [Eubacterium sp.]